MTLVYSVSTITETLYLTQLIDYIDSEVLLNTKASHILTSISYGANCTVTANYEYSNENEKFEIGGQLNAELKKIQGLLDAGGKAGIKYQSSDKNDYTGFKCTWYGDVIPRKAKLPEKFKEARDLAVKLPAALEDTNGGKGVPLKFTFVSVAKAKNWLDKSLESHLNLRAIDESTITEVMNVSHDIQY